MRERGILMSAPMVRALLERRKWQTRRLVTHRHGIHYLGGEGEEHDPACWGYAFDGPDHHGYAVLARGLDERHDHGLVSIPCPYGRPGDGLWVRETWRTGSKLDKESPTSIAAYARDAGYSQPWAPLLYQADGRATNQDTLRDFGGRWGKLRPAIHLPRWASRLTMPIAAIRAERLQDITAEDAIAEGLVPDGDAWLGAHNDARGARNLFRDPRDAFRDLWQSINGLRSPWERNDWVWAVAWKEIHGASA